MNRKNLIVTPIIILFVVIVLVMIQIFTQKNGNAKILSSSSDGMMGQQTLTEHEFEFQDLTIPYLREKEYNALLSQPQKVANRTNYTSYSTSFISDGFKVNAQLTIPTTKKPKSGYPAIVFVHGYIPPTLYKTFSNYDSYVNYFASRGIVVLKIDLRGHANSEGEANGAYYSSEYVVDVLNAYNALSKYENVNSKNIGLWGHSMAGNVVFRALAVKPNIPKVVIWAGAVYSYEDFGKYGISDNSYRPPNEGTQRRRRRDALFAKYGQFNKDSLFWKQVPATNYLDGIDGALQIHHAVNDDVVDIGYSRDLIKILDQSNIKYEFFEYQTGGHNISGTSFSQAMKRSLDFFSYFGE